MRCVCILNSAAATCAWFVAEKKCCRVAFEYGPDPSGGANRAACCCRMCSYAGHSRTKCFRSSTLAIPPTRALICARHADRLLGNEHSSQSRCSLEMRSGSILPRCTRRWCQPVLNFIRICVTRKGRHNFKCRGALERSYMLHVVAGSTHCVCVHMSIPEDGASRGLG